MPHDRNWSLKGHAVIKVKDKMMASQLGTGRISQNRQWSWSPVLSQILVYHTLNRASTATCKCASPHCPSYGRWGHRPSADDRKIVQAGALMLRTISLSERRGYFPPHKHTPSANTTNNLNPGYGRRQLGKLPRGKSSLTMTKRSLVPHTARQARKERVENKLCARCVFV